MFFPYSHIITLRFLWKVRQSGKCNTYRPTYFIIDLVNSFTTHVTLLAYMPIMLHRTDGHTRTIPDFVLSSKNREIPNNTLPDPSIKLETPYSVVTLADTGSQGR